MPEKRRIVTLCSAEIVDYATLQRRKAAEARKLAESLRRTLVDLLDRYGGERLESQPAGTLCAFPDPVNAASCALELQRVVQGAPGLPLRIALHEGELIVLEDDILGEGVAILRELAALPPAGAVLLSGSVYEQIRRMPRFDIVALGRLAGINIDRPVEVFALANQGLTVPGSTILQPPTNRRSLSGGTLLAIIVMVLLMIAIGVYIARIFLTAEMPR